MVDKLKEGSVAVEVLLNLQKIDLRQFYIFRVDLHCKSFHSSIFFLKHKVTIQRRLLSIILTTFLPTLIVNIVGHMSNYFKEFFFEGLISTNVTVLLVITTLFIRLVFRVPIFIGASIEIKWTYAS